MHVQRNVDQIRGDGVADEVALFIRSIFQQLLAEIIAERVGHQIGEVGKGLVEDDVSVFRGTFLQLLLEITTTMLIFAQAGNFTDEVLKTGTSKAVDYWAQSAMLLTGDKLNLRSTSPRLCLGP